MTTRIRSIFAVLTITTLAALAIAAQNAPTQTNASKAAKSYNIDAVHSTALFRVHHLGAGRFYGRFNDVTGSFQYGKGQDAELSFDVSIAVDSVDTNNDQLDGHLKSPDFFNAREFATMSFKSTSAKLARENVYAVTGQLSLHGVTRDLTTEVEFTGAADLGRGERCGFETMFKIKRSDFGMDYGVSNGMLGDETMIIVSLEGTEQ